MKKKAAKYPPAKAKKEVLNEAELSREHPLFINVRAAKDSLSSLLEQASHGMEIVITSDGQPKARLVPVNAKRKRFRVDRPLLRSIPWRKGARTAEEIIREDRDGRA